MVPLRFYRKLMIMHINLSYLQILGLVPHFNIADLKPYLGEDDELPSRTTSIQEGEDDEDIPTNVTPTSLPTTHTGPVTRARARQLNYQVLSFLPNPSNVHE